MQYQTFTGHDLREALAEVRATFGPNALIGPTRQIKVRGENGLPEVRIEVKAAPSFGGVQKPVPLSTSLFPDAARRADPERPRVGARARRPESPRGGDGIHDTTERSPSKSSALSKMESELAELRSLVEALKAQLPTKERAISLLREFGIEGPIAQRLGGRLGKTRGDDDIIERLRARLHASLLAPTDPLSSDRKELIACVGPTGVGKTTTLAKMAAQGRLNHGRSAAIICLDHYRVGALDQWQRYGKVMGVPIHTPKSERDLEQLLSESTADLLLVDTPSVGSKEDAAMRAFADLSHKARRPTHVFLLLPAWLRGAEAERLTARYEHLSPTGICATKLDEADGLGGVVQAAIAADLPIHYLSRGPRVPEHLELAIAETLVELCLKRPLSH